MGSAAVLFWSTPSPLRSAGPTPKCERISADRRTRKRRIGQYAWWRVMRSIENDGHARPFDIPRREWLMAQLDEAKSTTARMYDLLASSYNHIVPFFTDFGEQLVVSRQASRKVNESSTWRLARVHA